MNSRIYVFGLVGLSSLSIFALLAQPGLLSAKSSIGGSEVALGESGKEIRSTLRPNSDSAREQLKRQSALKEENLAALTNSQVEKLEQHH